MVTQKTYKSNRKYLRKLFRGKDQIFLKSQYGCHCNYPLCAEKFVKCEVCIKTVRTAYEFKSEWIEFPSKTHKPNCK